jgi:hypothetical protein
MTFTKTKLALNRNGIKLKDFIFNLAMGLIRSADERMYYIDRSLSEGITDAAQNLPLLQLPFQHNESTLMERLRKLKWLKRFKVKHFNKNRDLVELRTTQSKEIQHWFKTMGKTTAPFVTIVRQLTDANCVRYSFARHQRRQQ